MAIETIFGTQTKLVLVSQTHGSIRVPLNQNFDYTPRFTARSIFEFDRLDAAVSISTYEGADVRFEHLDTDSKLVDSAIGDQDPAATIVLDDPSNYKEIQMFANIKNSLGIIFQCVLAKGVKIKGSATTTPVREESRVTRDGEALNVQRIKGGAIEYTRALDATSTAFDQGAANDGTDSVAVTASGVTTYNLTNTPEFFVNGKFYLLALVNGTDNDALDSPYTIELGGLAGKTVIISPALGVNDVFELFTVYSPTRNAITDTITSDAEIV